MCYELYYISTCDLLPLLLLFQEVELWETCMHGLVEQVRYLLIADVNLNRTTFVSGLLDMDFVSKFAVFCQYYGPIYMRTLVIILVLHVQKGLHNHLMITHTSMYISLS